MLLDETEDLDFNKARGDVKHTAGRQRSMASKEA
jgi:hypothetical protein